MTEKKSISVGRKSIVLNRNDISTKVVSERRNSSTKRMQLLAQLENIIGNECFNSNIQNWGPGGTFEGEGREFRYPITYIDKDGKKIKRKSRDYGLTGDVVKTGYYAFGANELHIMRGLDKVLRYLEANHGFDLQH
jgi:hypothetical protein